MSGIVNFKYLIFKYKILIQQYNQPVLVTTRLDCTI